MAGGFRRSKWFGLVGIFVVAAIVVVIALSTGGGESNPKLTLGLIFAVVAIFFVVLFALQRSDLERVASAGDRGTARAAAEGGGRDVDNPTTISEPELWAALAVRPIDAGALRARSRMWDAGRRSQRLGMLIVLLIFLTVPTVYLLESLVPLLIGVPLIVIAAVYGGLRAVGPGGEMDRGYELVGEAMVPLGLEVVERPTVGIETRDPVTPRMGPRVRGDLVLAGDRHGRRVTVRLGSDAAAARSEVSVAGPAPEFEAKARDGRVRPAPGSPDSVAGALEAVPSSTRWQGASVSGGPEGITVSRRRGEQSDWMRDLWLAERLAERG
jgi:hypothetical protein